MAFYVALNIESFVPGERGAGLAPPFALPMDPMNQGWRDYGTRVGVWRMMELLDAHDLRASVLLNSDVCRAFPQIIEAGVTRNWAWLGHGVTNSRNWVNMEPAEEGRLLDSIVADLASATGTPPRGWLGPAFTETENTLPLLAERGFDYSLDWAGDDQPYPLEIEGRRFISIPYPTEINDVSAYLMWHWTPEQFATAILDQFATLHCEAKRRPGVVMALSIHPFLSNTPFRHGYLDNVLRHIRAHDDVWFPTTDEIAAHYFAEHYDVAVAAIAAQQRPAR
jgi:allantoinase